MQRGEDLIVSVGRECNYSIILDESHLHHIVQSYLAYDCGYCVNFSFIQKNASE